MAETKRLNIENIRDTKHRPLILDGAVGSLLEQNNHFSQDQLWASIVNINDPAVVSELHDQYIVAGADIITTNTFRTNPIACRRYNLGIEDKILVEKSVNLAKMTAKDKILVAGSNPPAEDCYQEERFISTKELDHNHKFHIYNLWQSGVDFILNETQSHFDEIKIICEFCRQNEIPFVMSLFFDKSLRILSGEPLEEMISFISDFSPLAISVNCIDLDSFIELSNQKYFPKINACYLNCGFGNTDNAEIFRVISPQDYINLLSQFDLDQFLFIGSCCGSNYNYTKAIKEYICGEN